MSELLLKDLKIEVTYKCPLACIHCSSNACEENSLSMPKQKCMDIINDAIKMGVTDISFSGGEPLLWEGLIDAVALASKNNIDTCVYTSGNCDNAEETFASLAKAGLKKAIFSLYSNDEQEHNRVTRKIDSYINTINSIGIAIRNLIIPEIHFVALASNYKILSDLAHFAKKIGVNKVSVLRFVPQGRGKLISKRDTLTKTQNIDLRNIILDLRQKGFEIRTGSPFNVLLLNENPKCMAAQDKLIVTPNTLIYPCDAFKQIQAEDIVEKVEYSDLNSSDLPSVWTNSTYLQVIRDAVASGPREPCKLCDKYSSCKSGCLAQKFLIYSSLQENPDPACIN